MKKDFIMPVLVLTIICVAVSGALALMNEATAPVIAAAATERAQLAMYSKIPLAEGFEMVESDNFPDSIIEAYNTTNDVGSIFIVAVPGFSGDITVMAAVGPSGNIIDVSTLSHTETRGIGTIIEMPSFLDTFIGLDSALESVDTVTGATVTTRAFIRAVEDALKAFEVRE